MCRDACSSVVEMCCDSTGETAFHSLSADRIPVNSSDNVLMPKYSCAGDKWARPTYTGTRYGQVQIAVPGTGVIPSDVCGI